MEDKKLLEITAKLFQRTLTNQIDNQCVAELPEEDKLTPVQIGCLRFVNLHSEPSVGGIADGLRISDAAAAKLIDRLVKRDMLAREEDTQDRRVLKIRLTAKGKAIINAVTLVEERYISGIVDRMSESELRALQNGLVAFLRASLVTAEEVDEVCLQCGVEHQTDCPGNLQYRELTGMDRSKV